MMKFLEGSMAVAEAVKLCKPAVISAYPITPQTHIVEDLSQFVADGELAAQFVNVESEFSAASVVLGGSATGVRVYTATTSQGLLLMTEVLYNIAGLRLPVVMTCVNRAVSAPISIWNDQQDSFSVRDAGWIQLYAENNQEAADLQIQAYKIAEDHRVMLPVMVCMDGYVLTHAFEPVDIPEQEAVDEFVPPYEPIYRLDPGNPVTFGALAEPQWYAETRYMIDQAMGRAVGVIEEVAGQFESRFARRSGGLAESYRLEDATTAIVATGSVVGTIKDTVDRLREQGKKIGVLKLVAFRPFPRQAISSALEGVDNIIVFDRAISLGGGGPMATELGALFHMLGRDVRIGSVIAGLGGRDITTQSIEGIVAQAEKETLDGEFLDLRRELVEEVA